MIPLQKLNFLYTSLTKTINSIKQQQPFMMNIPLHKQNSLLKPYYQMPDNKDTKQSGEQQHHGRHSQKDRHQQKKTKKKGKNDDDNNSGGMLQPLIQDLQGWVKRKRTIPAQ